MHNLLMKSKHYVQKKISDFNFKLIKYNKNVLNFHTIKWVQLLRLGGYLTNFVIFYILCEGLLLAFVSATFH